MSTSLQSDAAVTAPKTILDGRYEVIKTLGEGGFGVVYQAVQVSTGQSVAVKVLHADLVSDSATADTSYAKRFEREMNLIARLKHPNIVRLIDSGTTLQNQPFTVLEFIEGESLLEVLQDQGRISSGEALHLMTQVLDALSSAHKIGIIHRDLKPGNIMLTTTGYRRHAMVLDFGIATIVENQRPDNYQTLTRASEICGTPHYMAPEMLEGGPLTPQSDIYAWGLVFLECLTGQQAVTGKSPLDVVFSQISEDEIKIDPIDVDSKLIPILTGATRKPLDQRFSTADELLAELMELVHGPESDFSIPIETGKSNAIAVSNTLTNTNDGDLNAIANAETATIDLVDGSSPTHDDIDIDVVLEVEDEDPLSDAKTSILERASVSTKRPPREISEAASIPVIQIASPIAPAARPYTAPRDLSMGSIQIGIQPMWLILSNILAVLLGGFIAWLVFAPPLGATPTQDVASTEVATAAPTRLGLAPLSIVGAALDGPRLAETTYDALASAFQKEGAQLSVELRHLPAHHAREDFTGDVDVDLVLTGNVALENEMLTLHITLLEPKERVIRPMTFYLEIDAGIGRAQEELAQQVVAALTAVFQ